MKNRIEKAAQDYKTQYYGKHSNEGAFYASDFYEVKEAAEKSGGGRSNNPLRSDRDSARSGLYDRVQEGAAGLQEEAQAQQQAELAERLYSFFHNQGAAAENSETKKRLEEMIERMSPEQLKNLEAVATAFAK